MSFHTGCSGHVQKVGGGDPVIFITNWSIQKQAKLTEVSHSGNCGNPTVIGSQISTTGSFAAPWDDTQLPEASLGIDAGDTFTGKFFLGDSLKFFQFAFLVESIQTQNPVDGIVNYTVNFRASGTVTDPV